MATTATGSTGAPPPIPPSQPTTPSGYVLPESPGPQHVPASGPVTSITKATLKTEKDTIDVLDQLPALCGGSVSFPVMPIYTDARTKKLLTTTPEQDTIRGFPVVSLEIEYADKDGTHTDTYATTETVTLGERSTIGQVMCTPQTLVWTASMYAGYGVLGFLLVLMYLTNMIYSWKLWDGYAANAKTMDPADTSGMAYVLTYVVKYTANSMTKFIAVILAALTPVLSAIMNLVFTATVGYREPPKSIPM